MPCVERLLGQRRRRAERHERVLFLERDVARALDTVHVRPVAAAVELLLGADAVDRQLQGARRLRRRPSL